MNERIKKLAEQATSYTWNGNDVTEELDEQKFAELIVRECMLRVRSRQQFATEDEQNVTQAFDLLIYDLESLFGVEE